jgi:hypothetical protein
MKKLLILLTFFSVPSHADFAGGLFPLLTLYREQLGKNRVPHEGMPNPLKINQKEKIRSLMPKYECYLHLIQPLIIQRDAESVMAGTVKLSVVKRDFFNRRLLSAGTHLKLNSNIFDNKYMFNNKVTIVDSVISDVAMDGFWDSKIQKQNGISIFLASDGKLFLECSGPEAVIVK